MIGSNETMVYLTIFLLLVYIGKGVNFTKNGIIATIIGLMVVGGLFFYNKKNTTMVKKGYTKIQKNLKLKKYSFISIEPKVIKILRLLLDFKKRNSRTYYRILYYSNKFFKNFYIVDKHYKQSNHTLIENAILYSKKALNELASLVVSAPVNSKYEHKLILATKKLHKIFHLYIEDMKKTHKIFWKKHKIDIRYNPLMLGKTPYPNDTETTYYNEHFSLY